jgi:hypothetical protein
VLFTLRHAFSSARVLLTLARAFACTVVTRSKVKVTISVVDILSQIDIEAGVAERL